MAQKIEGAQSRNSQSVRCVNVRTVKVISKIGEVSTKEIYTFSLDGFEFEEWETSRFKASLDKCYTPLLFGYAKAYNDKAGKARVRNVVGINWVEAI